MGWVARTRVQGILEACLHRLKGPYIVSFVPEVSTPARTNGAKQLGLRR